MLKILLWVVANDDKFFNGALNILARQHGGIEFVGVTASAPIQLATGDKKFRSFRLPKSPAQIHATFYSSSAHGKSA